MIYMCLYMVNKGPILGYNLTHTTLFDYDRVDLRSLPFTEVKKLVST